MAIELGYSYLEGRSGCWFNAGVKYLVMIQWIMII